jgi:hypothetical protein
LVFGSNSRAIIMLGLAQGNAVLNNRIRGRARAALVVGLKSAGIPGNNAFVANDLGGFASSAPNSSLLAPLHHDRDGNARLRGRQRPMSARR